jgi:hypothetical protein
MENKKNLEKILIWIPSIFVIIFFVANAWEKIFQSNQITKLGLNSTSIILVGVVILVATALFSINKTVIIGTVVLSSYMVFVAIVHMSKGKPYFLTFLIVLVTIFAGYLRKRRRLDPKHD